MKKDLTNKKRSDNYKIKKVGSQRFDREQYKIRCNCS